MSHEELQDKREEAAYKKDVLARADSLQRLVASPGWTLIFDVQTAALERARLDLRKVDTGNHAAAIDALQRWQIAENMLEFQVNFINSTLEEATELRGAVTLDDALLMEKLNEQPKPGGDSAGDRPDPAGY